MRRTVSGHQGAALVLRKSSSARLNRRGAFLAARLGRTIPVSLILGLRTRAFARASRLRRRLQELQQQLVTRRILAFLAVHAGKIPWRSSRTKTSWRLIIFIPRHPDFGLTQSRLVNWPWLGMAFTKHSLCCSVRSWEEVKPISSCSLARTKNGPIPKRHSSRGG